MNNGRTSKVTLSTVGSNIRVAYPFNPLLLEVFITSKTGTGSKRSGVIRTSNGSWDGVRQSCHVIHDDGTNKFTDYVDLISAQVWETIGGTLTKILEYSIVGYDAVNLELILDVTTAHANAFNYHNNFRGFN